MATWNEVEARITLLQDLKDRLTGATELGPNRVQVGGRTLTVKQLRDLVSATDKQLKQLEKQLRPLRSAQAELARAKEVQANPITESPTGVRPADIQRQVAEAQAKVDDLSKTVFALPADVPSLEARRPGGMETVEMARGEVARQPAGRPRGATGPTAPTGPTGLATQGGGVSTGRGGAGAGGGTGGRRRVVNWEPKFREMFPAQAWLLDLDRTKYGDVFKLFQKAISDRMYETPEGQARFAAQLDGTSFFKELATTGKARDIKALVGDLGFDTVPFNKFLTTAMNMGWEGDTLKQEAYKEAFRKDDAGTYVNPTAVKRVQASNDYVRIKNIGRAFFSDVNDATVEQALTGGVTQDDIMRQQRELAKGKYAHLAPLLDQGLTLDDITSSYKERAARLLEKDVNDIDMGSADFSQAFNFGEEGKKRMMGDGEWEILLRSDQRFGWRKTQNAKQEATQLASSIAQAFGRVL